MNNNTSAFNKGYKNGWKDRQTQIINEREKLEAIRKRNLVLILAVVAMAYGLGVLTGFVI